MKGRKDRGSKRWEERSKSSKGGNAYRSVLTAQWMNIILLI
jgi:hypothetical protein